ncbi:hypothetical protein [Parabacteroides sp. PF5-6]|uniref:hypothetical protein n=1 Tax=Parabacteroides sp. PF5-6 TaxID=1742403 RepID=UPI0024072E4C|nr:hypothetical protein [Parabacteroides sp. PF5-6]MDF9831593.1 hypothetical protein [Parabacteroides sp. PF5-6]
MSIFSFYKMRKPRQFDHKPIYWDPRREDMEERERRIRRELGMEESLEDYKPQIKGKFVEGTSHLKRSYNRGEDARSRKYKNFKLALWLVVLAFIFWILFFFK